MIKLPQLTQLLVTLAGVISVPTLFQGWLSQPGHVAIYLTLVSVSVFLHAISPSLFGGPSADAQALATSAQAAAAAQAAAQPAAKLPTVSSTAKLGAWALIALLLPLPFMSGCSGVTVAQDIVNWTPALQSAVATVDSTAALLAPADAPIFVAATVGFDAGSNLLASQAKAYLANPSASVLAQIQAQVVNLQQSVNAAVLQAAKIMDPASQAHALSAINAVATIVSAILALVSSISSKAAIAQMAAASTVKLATVLPYVDRAQVAGILSAHYKNAEGFPAIMTEGTFGAGSAALSIGLVNLQADGF
jgi:hypothetical protein